jgi:hypothetical protein
LTWQLANGAPSSVEEFDPGNDDHAGDLPYDEAGSAASRVFEFETGAPAGGNCTANRERREPGRPPRPMLSEQSDQPPSHGCGGRHVVVIIDQLRGD